MGEETVVDEPTPLKKAEGLYGVRHFDLDVEVPVYGQGFMPPERKTAIEQFRVEAERPKGHSAWTVHANGRVVGSLTVADVRTAGGLPEAITEMLIRRADKSPGVTFPKPTPPPSDGDRHQLHSTRLLASPDALWGQPAIVQSVPKSEKSVDELAKEVPMPEVPVLQRPGMAKKLLKTVTGLEEMVQSYVKDGGCAKAMAEAAIGELVSIAEERIEYWAKWYESTRRPKNPHGSMWYLSELNAWKVLLQEYSALAATVNGEVVSDGEAVVEIAA